MQPLDPSNVSRTASDIPDLSLLEIPLERDVFLRTLLHHLAGALQDVVGIEEASGFVSIVGQKIGDEINSHYRHALRVQNLSQEQVAAVCVDLKSRIQGDFFVMEMTNEKIVFGNRTCPFAEKVLGRPSLCMMTSNVFGSIAAENLGYGKVVIEQAIANYDPGCLVTVYVQASDEARSKEGREYFKVN